MWYCVIRIDDLKLLYLGKDEGEAAAAGKLRTYLGIGMNFGDAMRRAAIGAGQLKRGKPTPNIILLRKNVESLERGLPAPELKPREPDVGD